MKNEKAKINKKIGIRLVSGICAVLWMMVIFMFSAQPADESSEISGRVSYRIVSGLDRVLQMEKSRGELEQAAEKIEFPVRKMAHMCEYAVLSLLFLALFYAGDAGEYSRLRGRPYMFSFFLTAVYAATDEFHQLFVPGRAGRILDVFTDSAGALIALLLAGFTIKIINKGADRQTVR